MWEGERGGYEFQSLEHRRSLLLCTTFSPLRDNACGIPNTWCSGKSCTIPGDLNKRVCIRLKLISLSSYLCFWGRPSLCTCLYRKLTQCKTVPSDSFLCSLNVQISNLQMTMSIYIFFFEPDKHPVLMVIQITDLHSTWFEVDRFSIFTSFTKDGPVILPISLSKTAD